MSLRETLEVNSSDEHVGEQIVISVKDLPLWTKSENLI